MRLTSQVKGQFEKRKKEEEKKMEELEYKYTFGVLLCVLSFSSSSSSSPLEKRLSRGRNEHACHSSVLCCDSETVYTLVHLFKESEKRRRRRKRKRHTKSEESKKPI